MALTPEEMAADTPRARFVRWRKLIGDAEITRRLQCSIHTVNAICRVPDGKPYKETSVRTPGLDLAFRIERETTKDWAAARSVGFDLPIRAREIAGGWG